MNIWNYSTCDIEKHDQELLNMVCIDPKCNKNQLICCFCKEQEHQNCYTIATKKFLDQYKLQLNSQMNKQSLKDIYVQYEKFMDETKKTLKEKYEKQQNLMSQTELIITQLSQQQQNLQGKQQKLQNFVQYMNQENFKQIFTEIDLKPNSDRFSFTIKQTLKTKVDRIEERIKNGNDYLNQYKCFINNFFSKFEKQQQNLEKMLFDYFSNSLQSSENQTYFFQMKEYNNLAEKTFTNANIQNELNKMQNHTVNLSQNRNQTSISDNISQRISSPYDQLNDNKKNLQQFQQNTSLIPQSQQMTSQQFQQKITQQTSSNGKEQQVLQQKHQLLSPTLQYINQQQQQQQQQQLQQQQCEISKIQQFYQQKSSQFQQQLQQQQISKGELYQKNNQEEIFNRQLKINQIDNFQFEKNSNKFNKLLFLSQSVIAGFCGTQFQLYNFITHKVIQKINVEADVSGAEYMESNGTLFLATINGKVYTYMKESNIENSFKLKTNYQSYVVDKFGTLLIQINQEKQQLITFGEDKIIKIWQMKDFNEVDSWNINEVGTVLYFDSQYIYVGGNNRLHIWGSSSQFKKIISILQICNSKIIFINKSQNNLIVGLQDQILVYEVKKNQDHILIFQKNFGVISSMNILKKWLYFIVSCANVSQNNPFQQQKQQQVVLYLYKKGQQIGLQEQIVSCFAVEEYNNVQYVGFMQENGKCLIYTIQQTQEKI